MKPLKRNAGPRLALALVAMILLACPAAHADCSLAPPGLVSWYQAAGNALDSVGTNHGTLTGSAGFTNGIVGQSFVLDGLDGGVNLGNVPAFDFTPDSSFSIEAWFDSFGIRTSGNDGQLIVALNNQCGNEAQALVMGNNVSEFGVVKFLVRDVNGLLGLAVSPAAASNQFHHVVGVRDVNGVVKTLRLYLDGVLVDTQPDDSTGAIAINAPDWIGRRNTCGSDNVFNGIIDEVSIYNRALTPLEVQAIFNAGSAGKCVRRISWFKVAGGGGESSNAVHRLRGTAGQLDAGGPLTNNQYALAGGFWALPTAIQVTGAPTLTIAPATPGNATISWTPNTSGFVLQETLSLSPTNWVNAPSGTINPIVVPATLPTKFYRLFKP
ncbi:MAG: LamG domain-containing protein [Verrucomicrobia bacterium]|nr:LamG domain-containing protein [Verrucomicrobiota bacterium]